MSIENYFNSTHIGSDLQAAVKFEHSIALAQGEMISGIGIIARKFATEGANGLYGYGEEDRGGVAVLERPERKTVSAESLARNKNAYRVGKVISAIEQLLFTREFTYLTFVQETQEITNRATSFVQLDCRAQVGDGDLIRLTDKQIDTLRNSAGSDKTLVSIVRACDPKEQGIKTKAEILDAIPPRLRTYIGRCFQEQQFYGMLTAFEAYTNSYITEDARANLKTQ